jgi:hypothetical protein
MLIEVISLRSAINKIIYRIRLIVWFFFFEAVFSLVIYAFEAHPYALASATLAPLSICIGAFLFKPMMFSKPSDEPPIYTLAIYALALFTLVPLGIIIGMYGFGSMLSILLLPITHGLPWVVPCGFLCTIYLYFLPVCKST